MTLTLDLGCFPLESRPYRHDSEYTTNKLGIGRLTD